MRQYDLEHRALNESYQECMDHIETTIGVDLEDADSEAAAIEVNMAFKCDGLWTRFHELGVKMRQPLEQPPQ